ncbi:MAG: PHP domain-containing protein [Candidatus Hadarchaeota archaeon]
MKTDLHIHSIHSGHAYGTLGEIVREAVEKDMDVIGISDHGPAMEGSATKVHFFMGPRIPNFDVEVLWGCEANVLNGEGETDLPQEREEDLDYAALALHLGCGYEDRGKEGNTKALLRAMDNPNIKFISHPANQHFPVDLVQVLEGAIERNIWLEINLSYLRHGDENRILEMIDLGKSLGGTFVVNSDAHFVQEIGDDQILEDVGLDLDELNVVNNDITPSNALEKLSR